MSLYDHINRISNAKNHIQDSITYKGINMSQNTLIHEYASIINNMKVLDRNNSICLYDENNKLLKCIIAISNNFYSKATIDKNIRNISIGNNITNISCIFQKCTNLKTAVCSPHVTNMCLAYSDCTNLTTAVCGPNVTDMSYAYRNCTNLTTAVCGPNVTDISGTYYGCTNIHGNCYFYPSDILYTTSCFYGRNTSKRLNIYMPSDSTTLESCLYGDFLVGGDGTFSGIEGDYFNEDKYQSHGYYYSDLSNIYIYPVANVAAARAANGD